ncbi:Hsp70 chaperone protein [Fusarium mexicanum]|uniref:Hsp70 chaperone protein n=1 Tax=Fusarium mexicanum TaxID=751941 RepID=A0A8H5IS12_9HYPO|nr:Hsp70 chaperone protein [Fusarium mexicanum]
MSPQLADKLVMALDFGETNSSVSYTFIPEGSARHVQVMSHSEPDQMLLHGFKSLMTESAHHQVQNKRLIKSLSQLSQKMTCEGEVSIHEMLLLVVIDYLTKLLNHAKDYIAKSNAISTTEMVICVPVSWKQRALRDMQTCVNIAMKRVNFPGVRFSGGWMENVFMISEPEAAATRLLSNPSFIKEEDVFTLLDAGGATCDAVTYIVTQTLPLRLSRQAVHHSGDSCGSNALNDAFQGLLRDLLVGHEYLNEGGATLEGHICKLAVHDFEHFIKPIWFATEEKNADQQFEIMGLKFDAGDPDQADNPQLWQPNRLTIRSGDLDGIYKNVCENVSVIMKQQLHAAAQRGRKKVVLAGGFGESIPLQRHLRETLEIFNVANNCDVELHLFGEHHQITTIDAVSLGGVLRALDKSNSPTRVATSSYGIRCDEPFEGPKHDGQPVIRGFQKKHERYVQAIEWISKKAGLHYIPPLFEKFAKRIQTFPYWNADHTVNHGPFICQEEIWVSDKARLDHRSYRDKHNEDAEMIGILETDVTNLRQYFIRKPNESQDPHHNDSRRWYWEFPHELVVTIDGLNMKCVQVFNGQQIGAMRVGIAPGFTPGVN